MRFKVEKLKVALECAIKDKSEVDDLVHYMFKGKANIQSFENIPGEYEFARLTYTHSTFRIALVSKPEGAPEKLSYSIRIPVNPNDMIGILTEKALNKFVINCGLNMCSYVPKEKELMSIDEARALLDTIESKTCIRINDEGLKFNSDVPARVLKVLCSKDSMVIYAGTNGDYRFRAEYNYLDANYCINLINRFTKLTRALNKGSTFGGE